MTRKEFDLEVIAWEDYFAWEQLTRVLWLEGRKAFRDYLRTRDEGAWNMYLLVMDRYWEIADQAKSARKEWQTICQTLHVVNDDEQLLTEKGVV